MSYLEMVMAGLAQPVEALLSLLGLAKDAMLTAPEVAARFQTAFPTAEVVVADHVYAPEGGKMFDDQMQMSGLSIRQFGEGIQCTSGFRVMGAADGDGRLVRVVVHPDARMLTSHVEAIIKQLEERYSPAR